jgi:hypothetical protein
MNLPQKLQLPKDEGIRVLNAPENLPVETNDTDSESILLFAKNSEVLKTGVKAVVRTAKANKLAWVAYPKAGKLGTDLNRDKLWKLLERYQIQPVRAISIDDTWSALRFKSK